MHCRSLVLSLLLLELGLGCAKAPSKERHSSRDAQPEPALTPQTAIPDDVVTSDSGLMSKVLKPGQGDRRPAPQDKVRVNFSSTNAKGEVVDSSEKRGGPVTYDVTGVIAGWSEALQQMRVGEQRRLWVPDHLAYPGRPGSPRPPAVFDLELLEIIEGEPPRPAPDDVAAAPKDAKRTPSGLAYKLLRRSGSTERPRAWDRVTMHHVSWTTDGVMVESSRRERPSVYDLGHALPGLREALPLLAVGDSARLWIPEPLAYAGRAGEPKGTVVFDVELVSIERRPEPPRPPAHLTAAPPNAKKTKSGLAYRIVRPGKGKIHPQPSDRVEVHYSAWTGDGKLLDSSFMRGAPTTVPVGRVIAGWGEGLQLMVEGDKALFWIPEALAYGGKEGTPQGMLVYEVELLKIER